MLPALLEICPPPDTVQLAGRVPEIGESVTTSGFEFFVREADERRVTRVEVRRVDPQVHDAAE